MAVIASLSLACSCNTRLHEPDPADGTLSILPSIQGATLTKATELGDDTQRENTVVKLDVFVNGEFSDNTSWRVYHLDAATDRIEEGVNTVLNQNWRNNGYTAGKAYQVYVAANSPETKSLTVNDLTSTAVLQNLIHWDYDPEADSKDGQKMPYWPDGTVNPEWLNIHKSYVKTMPEGSNPGRVFTTDKDYLMDGFTTFTPDASVNSQVIPVSLDRVASKIVVDVKFDTGFLAEIKKKGLEVTGAPGWRFFNFAYNAPVFDPAKTGWTAPEYTPSVFSAGALLLGNATYADKETKDFQISTYSYPRSWEAGRALMDAPAINISIGYKKGDKTSFNYYRIPIVEATTTEIGRNKIYKVTATIASMGSTLLDENIDTKLLYEVLDWNDANDADATSVDYKQSYYLQVSPSNITLRGNGTQDVNIKYSKPAKQKIGILYFPNQAAAEAKDYQFGANYADYKYTPDSPAAYYYNKDKNYRTTFDRKNVQKSIEDNGSGTIAVSSDALLNKAVKYIKFRVYLNVEGWEAKKLYKDVIIKHYPTDNIQSIEGLWSSRTSNGWVNWTRDNGKTYDRANAKYTNDNNFTAKVYNESDKKIYAIDVDREGDYYSGTYSYSMATSQYNFHVYTTSGIYNRSHSDMTGLTNNHMYVVQISATSANYVLGRPELDKNYQSADHVVSPAFMIASQLGAVQSFGNSTSSARNAALHCGTYKEVTEDTEYTGWRLPTAEEVNVIIKYQGTNGTSVTIDDVTISGDDRVMTPVLTGNYYHTLNGIPQATHYESSDSRIYYAVRCVRDLTPQEIAKLNQ